MDMEIAVHVGVPDLRRIDPLEPVLGGDGGGDVVVQPLEGIAHVAVFVDPPVGVVQIAFDELEALGEKAFPFPDFPVLLAVEDVGLGDLGVAPLDEHFFDQVLDVFNGGYPAVLVNDGEDADNGIGNSLGGGTVAAADGLGGLVDGIGYFFRIKGYDPAVAFSYEIGIGAVSHLIISGKKRG